MKNVFLTLGITVTTLSLVGCSQTSVSPENTVGNQTKVSSSSKSTSNSNATTDEGLKNPEPSVPFSQWIVLSRDYTTEGIVVSLDRTSNTLRSLTLKVTKDVHTSSSVIDAPGKPFPIGSLIKVWFEQPIASGITVPEVGDNIKIIINTYATKKNSWGFWGAQLIAAEPKNTTVSNSTQNAVASKNAPKWNATVLQKAMDYIDGRTNVPLEAPTEIKRKSNVYHPYLSAKAQEDKNAYNITLQYTTTPLPVNSSQIDSPPNTGLAQVVGGFDGKVYSSTTAARTALKKNWSSTHPSQSPEKINLGDGIVADVYNQTGLGIVDWDEGDWSFEVNNGTVTDDITLARQIVAYLAQHSLPNTYGTMTVINAGDGEHTSLQ